MDKLLGGRLPEFVRSAGKTVFERQRHLDVRVLTLKEQLRQQAVQVAGAETQAELLEELADALHLVLALGKAHGINADQLEARRRSKHEPSVAPAPRRVFRLGTPLLAARFRTPLLAAGFRTPPLAAGFRTPLSASGFHALRTRDALASAITLLGAAPGGLMPVWRVHARLVAGAPQARVEAGAMRLPSAAKQQKAPGRYLPVVIASSGTSAAAWIVATTSRAVLRYVVRPYLVRYLQTSGTGTRIDQGSRALVRLMLPSLAT